MATPFEKIYDKFFLQIGDDAKARIFRMKEIEREEYLYALLEESIVYFKKCRKKLINRDFITKQFDEELSDEELSILAYGMILVWIRPKVTRLEHLKQSLGDRDFKKSSNWQTLNSLLNLKDNTQQELKSKLTDYTFNFISEIKVKK